MGLHIGAFDTAHPGDMDDLKRQLAPFDPARMDRLALLVKTEGNAEINDYSREYGLLSAQLALREIGGDRLVDHAALLFSTGAEGAYTPFGYYFLRTTEDSPKPAANQARGGDRPNLAMGIARSRRVALNDVGTPGHVQLVADTVTAGMADAGLTADQVAFVIVKNPVMALVPATEDPERSAPRISPSRSKAVGALGAGVALGEVDMADVTQESIHADPSIYSRRAMSFSGAEVDYVDVIVFGNRPGAGSGLIAHATQVKDLLDGKSMRRMLEEAGCPLDRYGDVQDPERIVAFFSKLGIAADGTIRGRRTTMRTSQMDPDNPMRAAATGLVHSIIGTTRSFISADTVQQAPPGGGLCACIVRDTAGT